MSTKTLTVFTPTFNRAQTLYQGYEALQRQTCRDFVWLILDDGSSDGTCELVSQWIAENKIDIRYHYQDNQGLHVAHNTAYGLIDTELFMYIDSDDYLPDDAVENIISCWRMHQKEEYAGIIGLCQTSEGILIGKRLPENQTSTTFTEYFYKKGGEGDKILVYRTEVIRKYPPYPVFEGEKYVGLASLTRLIDRDYRMVILNKPLSNKKYCLDGISRNRYHLFWNNPKGYIYYRINEMQTVPTLKRRFMVCIHYVSSCIRAKDTNWLVQSPYKLLTLLAAPWGLLLHGYLWYKVKSERKFILKY